MRKPQQGFRSLDAPCHEVGVRRFAIRGAELAREMGGRHVRGTRHGRDIEGLRVLAVDEVTRPAQVREVSDLLRRHADDGTRPEVVAAGWGGRLRCAPATFWVVIPCGCREHLRVPRGSAAQNGP
jgi:hypothetical protein